MFSQKNSYSDQNNTKSTDIADRPKNFLKLIKTKKIAVE